MAFALDPEETETGVLHDLVDFRHKDVLEVGCGDGRLTQRYAHHASTVLAFDPKAEEVARAYAQLPEMLRGRVAFQVGDITTMELPIAAYDVALLAWSIC